MYSISDDYFSMRDRQVRRVMLKSGDVGCVSMGKKLSKEVSEKEGPLQCMAGGIKSYRMYSWGCFD